ncbi:MAG TPA: carboxypeptidase regulatory-like domain-containing protein [Polyangiaceae bacterium]
MTRNRTLAAIVACAIALVGLGILLFRALAPAASPPNEGAAARAASSSSGPSSQRRRATREQAPLVSPRAEAERATSGASIAGRVVDDLTGGGVANAALTFLRGGSAISADTTGDGRFALEGLEPGVYQLYAIGAPGYAPFEADLGRGGITLRVEPNTRLRDVTLSLRALWFAEGKVTDPGGAPVAGAEVRSIDGDGGAVVTGPDGDFAIECSLGGALEASHARFAPGRATCDRSARLGRPVALRLGELKAAAVRESIAGRVVDASGRGIEGALVVAERRDGSRSAPTATESVSRSDGNFSLEALEAGAYDVSATAGGLAKAVANGVRTGERQLELRLVAGGRLRGLARERASGRPIVGFSIVFWPMRGALERGAPQVRTFFAPDGRFEIESLSPGDYSVTALAEGFQSAEERRVTLAGGASEDVVLDLALGGRVFGTVRDTATGKPLVGAQVGLESTLGDQQSAVPLLASSVCDDQGSFELRGVGAGRFSLSVSAPDHHHKLSTGLTLRPGGELGPLRIDLEPTAPGEEPKFELHGIGAVLRPEGDAIIVADIVADGGAARAGLARGDRILSVDGVPVTSLGFQGTIEHIRGPEGTAVRLQIRRAESDLHLVAQRGRVRR